MKYPSGEDICKGDQVLFHGEPGEIEYLAETPTGDPVIDWNLKHNGPGVMILEPKFFGRVYLSDSEAAEDLVFVSRKETKT
jgi:hypothetical protein